MKKFILIGLAALVLVAAAYITYVRTVGNARVAEGLRSDPGSTRAARTMLITLEDGREYPVNYLREGEVVYMGIDGPWWRAFRDGGAPVTLLIRGQQLTGHAAVVLDDPERVADVFSRLRPTAPEWLPAWLNGRLVVIDLEPR